MRPGGYEKLEGMADFLELFPDEESCRSFLFRRRWPQGFVCPRCGGEKCYPIRGRLLYQCASCRYQASLTAGTVMEKTRTGLWNWFLLIFLMARSKTGLSIMSFSKLCGISYKRAWLMAHRIRRAMEERDSLYLMPGLVEMDESYFGTKRRDGSTGRGASGKRPVLVGLSVDEQERPLFCRMRVMEGIKFSDLEPAAATFLAPSLPIRCDDFPAYRPFRKDHPMEIRPSRIGPKEFSPSWIHVIVANVKGMLRGVHHGVSPKHLQPYLSEFSWRFSRRFWEGELFDRLLWACVNSPPLTRAELAARPVPAL